ncbi:MAG: hypothetical protein J0L92_03185 [Deltaproteobacteria bacterium]|nr:hypothetical protein [Deltaproteobacteria bacterium]
MRATSLSISFLLVSCGAASVRPSTAALEPTLPAPLTPRGEADENRVWLEPTRAHGEGLVLFADDVAPIEDAIARALARTGYDVVPPDERRAAITRMRAGHLPDREGQCAPMPPAAGYLAARYEGLVRISSTLACRSQRPAWNPEGPFTPGCVLTVATHRGEGPVEREGEIVFPLGVSREVIIESLERDAIALHDVEPEDGAAMLLGMMGEGSRVPVAIRDVETMGPWDATLAPHLEEHLERALAPHRETLLACDAHEPLFDHWGNDFVIEVRADGVITRCEPELEDHRARASMPCECAILSRVLDFGSAPSVRRLRFAMHVDVGVTAAAAAATHYASAELRVRDADDRSIEYGDPALGPQLQACLEGMGGDLSNVRLLANLVVGADGRVLEARARPIAGDAIDPTLDACAMEALRATRFTCPFTGRAEVRAELDLFRARFGGGNVDPRIVAQGREGPSLPRAEWHLDVPQASAPTFYATSDGSVVDAAQDSVDGVVIPGEDVRLVVYGDVPVARIARWLQTIDAPRLRRVFFVVEAGDGEPIWRLVHVVREAPADPHDALEVSSLGVARRSDDPEREIEIESEDPEELSEAIDPRSSEPLYLEASEDDPSLQSLLRAVDAARGVGRRAVWRPER